MPVPHCYTLLLYQITSKIAPDDTVLFRQQVQCCSMVVRKFIIRAISRQTACFRVVIKVKVLRDVSLTADGVLGRCVCVMNYRVDLWLASFLPVKCK